jgi:hypothetical protein
MTDQKVNEKHEYLFNFIGGGWNSVYAYTIDEAIEYATAFYNDERCVPDVKSFRVSTESDYRNLLLTFH